MKTVAAHLPALIVLGIAAGLVGALAAIGAITGTEALTVFLAVLAPTAALFGVKYGATASAAAAPTTTTTTTAAAAPAAPAPGAQVVNLAPPAAQ
jgi:hypothetical protein